MGPVNAEQQGNLDCCMSKKGHLDGALSVEEQSSQRQDPHIGGPARSRKVIMAEARARLHHGIAAKHAGNKGITRCGNKGITRRWRCGAEESCWRWLGSAPSVAALLVLCGLGHGDAAALMEGRYKDDRTCSLQTVQGGDIAPMEYCSFLPGRGENRHKRVLIQFGESRCKFTLRNCVPGYCYVIHDFSAFLPHDVDIYALGDTSGSLSENFRDLTGSFGIFKNATVEGADLILSTKGIFFTPKQSDVTISYTTKTCAEYYSEHGRLWPQLCEGALGLLSNALPASGGGHLSVCTRQGIEA